MISKSHISRILLAGCATAALSACGADNIASPGSGGDITINYPSDGSTSTPTPTPTATVTPATGCPTIADPQGLTDGGTITGPTGEYRVCSLPTQVQKSITLPKIAGLVYELPGRVDVGCDRGPSESSVPASCSISPVTLTIDPGVIVYGGTGVSWLAVNRGNKIHAVGTASQPIIFTSRDNILGLNTENSSGQWGGVVLMGRAPITDCVAGTPGTESCYRTTEGAASPAYYGGATGTDNSGELSYVQIRYSGYVLSANNELQSLTLEGVGSGTTIDHIQSYNSSDDGTEYFGGHVNMKYYVSIGAEDDNIDTDTGVQLNLQYVLAVQRTGGAVGDAMIEADSDNSSDGDTPRQHTKVSNATFIQRSTSGGDGTAILLRGGTDYTLLNSLVVSPNLTCLKISRPQTASTVADASIDELGAPVFQSVQMQCGSPVFSGANGVTDAQVQSIFEAGSNNSSTFTPSLTSVFINGANETAIAAVDPSSYSSYFDAVSYIGAVKDANDDWYKGWTCNSGSASFDDTSNSDRLCTSLPTA